MDIQWLTIDSVHLFRAGDRSRLLRECMSWVLNGPTQGISLEHAQVLIVEPAIDENVASILYSQIPEKFPTLAAELETSLEKFRMRYRRDRIRSQPVDDTAASTSPDILDQRIRREHTQQLLKKLSEVMGDVLRGPRLTAEQKRLVGESLRTRWGMKL